MRPWSKRRRLRYLAVARLLDRFAASLRRKVRLHTPKRSLRARATVQLQRGSGGSA